jgi:hypothetical protein
MCPVFSVWIMKAGPSVTIPMGPARKKFRNMPSVCARFSAFAGEIKCPLRLHWGAGSLKDIADLLTDTFEFCDYSIHTAGEIFCVAGRERGEFRTGGDGRFMISPGECDL